MALSLSGTAEGYKAQPTLVPLVGPTHDGLSPRPRLAHRDHSTEDPWLQETTSTTPAPYAAVPQRTKGPPSRLLLSLGVSLPPH